MRNEQFYNRHSRPLRELQVGDFVQIQNQEGHYPRRWTKTGRIVDTCGNRQYQVRVDGSNRVTARNRRFLRKIYPVVDGPHSLMPRTADPSIFTETPQQQIYEEAMDVDSETDTTTPGEPIEQFMEIGDTTDVRGDNTNLCLEPVTPLPLRQPSCRVVRPPRNLSPHMRGKSHEFSGTY